MKRLTAEVAADPDPDPLTAEVATDPDPNRNRTRSHFLFPLVAEVCMFFINFTA